ncbi:DNA cytosine methyltransferase [Pseudomonas graminis]
MQQPTIGSLFAGIGGFDVGFENAGYRTAWQVELNPINRAVLADRFPHARQFEDVRECGAHNLSAVDVITAGFPCQDISIAGCRERNRATRGLQGERSGLFWEVVRILKETQPRWVVLENVVNLLAVNDSRDFETVIRALADCGYVGFWRVLNAQYFEVPQQRRRVFLVAGYRRMPPTQLLADAAPVDAQYLQRLNRSAGHGPRMPGLPILYWQTKPDRRSLWAVPLSSLTRTDGIRWLSGSERLKMMGFASDWMRPTLRRLSVPEMPLLRRSRSGLGGG